MNKSAVVHLKNKYPTAKVVPSDTSVDVFSDEGVHLVALRKDGQGMWVDRSEEFGCRDKWCNAPIPRHARHWQLRDDGSIVKHEHYDARRPVAVSYEKELGKVPSLHELAGGSKSQLESAAWLAQFDKHDVQVPKNALREKNPPR